MRLYILLSLLVSVAAPFPVMAADPDLPDPKTPVQTEAQVEERNQKATHMHALQLTEADVQAEAHGRPWSLDSCIHYAISHNLDVRGAYFDLKGGYLDVVEAKDRFLPTLSASASQGWAFGRGLTSQNTYADRNTSTTGWNVGFQLPLFQGLSALRQLRLAQSRMRTLDLQLAHARDEVTLQVIGLYLQTLYNREMVSVRHEELRLSEVQLRLQQDLLEGGKVPEADVLQARAQVASNQVSVINAENDYRLAIVDLTRALELGDVDGFDIQELDFAHGIPAIPRAEKVYDEAMECNNGLLAARSAVRDADCAISAAKTGYIPQLSFNAGVGSSFYSVSGTETLAFNKQMKDNFATSVGFSLNIPIFDAFSTRNQLRRACLQRRQAMLDVERRESELLKTIRQAHSQAVGARAQYQAGEWSVQASKAALEAMTEKYTYGRANATEWQQAQTDYITTLAQLLQAKYELILRCRILRFYMGRDN